MKSALWICHPKNHMKTCVSSHLSNAIHCAVYKVDFDSQELIKNAISAINKEWRVKELTYRVETGEINSRVS